MQTTQPYLLLVTCCGVPDFIVPHACWRYLVLLQEGKGIYLMVYVKFFLISLLSIQNNEPLLAAYYIQMTQVPTTVSK